MFWPAIVSWGHRLLLGVPSRAHPLPHLLPRAKQLRGFPLPRTRHLRGGFPVSRARQLRGFPLFARRRLFGVGGPPISGTDAGAVQAVARADGALLEARLAIKTPPKKTQKTPLKNPLKMVILNF